MRFVRLLLAAVLALATLPSVTGKAMAEEAAATTHLNVRSGPSSSFAIVDTLTPGEVVDMTECQASGWCYITHSGPDGWVNSAYLTAPSGSSSSDPNCRFQLYLGPDGPEFRLICGDGDFVVDTGPGPTPTGNQACFYDGPNFTGDRFCRSVGTYNSLPPAADDRITSVRLYGSARVRLCERVSMGPFCRDVTTSTGSLGPFLNNRTSSLRVYTGSLPPKRQVCLFDGSNYTGQHLCLGLGIQTLPPAAQNRATSIRLFGGARIRLSKSPTYGVGPAYNVTSNIPALPPFWNNQTRSVWVYD